MCQGNHEMRNLTVVYAKGNADQFERNVPLHFIGQRNAKLGFSNDIDILFLDGYDRLDEHYRVSLQELGFNLYDVQEIYSDLSEKYSSLNRFGDLNQKCFLRWLVIKEFFAGEKIIHYDADVVFNEDPLIINRKLAEKTFVLQGCPALACISDVDWFSHYEDNLKLFVNAMERYSNHAWIEREGWELSEQHKWAARRFSKVIASDQDFISHLIHTDQIKQDKPLEILPLLKDYAVFENPLYIHSYMKKNLPVRYERVSEIDYFGNKRVLFWHMQSSFYAYLYRFILRRRFLPILSRRRLTNHLERMNLETYILSLPMKIRGKISNGTNTRLTVYKFFFEKHDFSGVMNSRTWWRDDVFE